MIVGVADRGRGFAPGDEKRVWEKFYRGPVEGVRGAGLGSQSAENRDGGGALIRISLPARTAPQVRLDG